MRSVHHIEAPVETVYEYFYDPRKGQEFAVTPFDLGEVKLTKEGTGSFFTWQSKLGFIPLKGFDLYTEVEPNKHIVEKSSNALVGTWEYWFEPEGSGTKVIMEHHSRSLWGLPPVSFLTDLVTTQMNEKLIGLMKESLETAK